MKFWKIFLNRLALDLIETLKSNGVIDTPDWCSIQRLADIRNLYGYNKEKEPTEEDIEDLIKRTGKIIKTLF